MCINHYARVLFIIGLITIAPAQAARIERLVMPGSLIAGHAETENQCGACHERDGNAIQNDRCLHCHEEVQADLEQNQGFHGRNAWARSADCSTCHSDHKGSDAKITGLDPELFNHEDTDFPLLGMHKQQACTACHTEGDAYRDTTTECVGCHEDDDVHEDQLGNECESCHDAHRWSEQRFDHADTDFPLLGQHEQTTCASCHLEGLRYEDTQNTCDGCHSSSDVHFGTYGKSCDDCHSPEKWDEAEFNHDKTQFALRGSHRDVDCKRCHPPASDASNQDSACIACHDIVDVHNMRFGNSCDSCHDESNWQEANFDHDKETDFFLDGAHTELNCHACHGVAREASSLEIKQEDCFSCHAGQDVHRQTLGEDCASCHNTTQWASDINFDHDFTNFPLYGMHRIAPCETCHVDARFEKAPGECQACHEDDDYHDGTLGSACQSCHNANDWTLWRFNHAQTEFPLEGAHASAACNSCHTSTPVSATPNECVSCHAGDDIHRGEFGKQCDRCHNPESFKTVFMPTGQLEDDKQ
jgi:hypothetical protein